MEKFADFRRAGKTVVIVSHAMGSMRTLCTEAAWLSKGRLERLGDASDIVDSYFDSGHAERQTPADIAGGPTAAQLMWDWPNSGVPNGENGPNEVWFRYTFNLALTPDALPVLAQALVIADDEFELFVNGTKYDFGHSTALVDNMRSNGQPNPLLADFTSLLRNGTNVLAIHAADGSLAAPHDELYEYVFFDGRIVTVPEPGSMVLWLSGVVLMTGVLGQRRRGR